MVGPEPALIAFLVGVTAAGLIATIAEIATGPSVRFGEPYISRDRVILSVALAVMAGPFMLGNEVIAAHRRRTINAARLAIYAMVAFSWALSLGVLLISLASFTARLLA